jgi:hypothetical protein
MARNGTYYLGRVLKLGSLTQASLMQALASPRPIQSRGGNWALVNVHLDPDSQFVFGRLARYLPEGRVDVVDPNTLSTESQIEPNLLVASVPFVYIPAHSGIAFLANSSNIDHLTFIRRFCSIIEGSLDNFFVECQVQVITDLRAFAIRVSALDAIYKIQSRVSPPNPLFGPLWENLKNYLIQRNADRLNLTENAGPGEALQSVLPELASSYTENAQYPDSEFLNPIPIGDAAILMAVDGYGIGIIRGRIESDTVVIKTSETIANFNFEKDPLPEELYSAANDQFERIKVDRYMEHG